MKVGYYSGGMDTKAVIWTFVICFFVISFFGFLLSSYIWDYPANFDDVIHVTMEVDASASFSNTKTIEIDGCEYIQFTDLNRRTTLTHKGNCKNPVHVVPGVLPSEASTRGD